MLEARIEELTKAIRDLIDVMHNQQGAILKSVCYADVNKDRSGGEVVKQREAEIVKAEIAAPNETPKSSPTTNTSEPSSPESAPVTYADVKKLVIAISKTSRDKAIAALRRLGVANATELKDHQWPAALAYLTKVAAGEVDPESAHE